MCGEKKKESAEKATGTGSPPHVRGKAVKCPVCGSDNRITPACAGKSLFGFLCGVGEEDHPRMCGEKTKKIP